MATFAKAIPLLKIIHLPKGEYIFEQDEIGKNAYVILTG